MTRYTRTTLAAVTLCLSPALTACGDAPAERPTDDSSRAQQQSVDVQAAAMALGTLIDEPEVESPTEYFESSDLVVRGEVARFSAGRILFAEKQGDPGALSMVVMQVRIADTLKGVEPRDGMAFVEMPLNGYDVAYFNEAIPAGTEVALYLAEAVTEESDEGGQLVIGNDDAGLPVGSAIWEPMGSKAVVLAVDGGTATPVNGTKVYSSSLSEQLPS